MEAFEPKRRELIQDRALVRDRLWQNDVKSRQAIGGDEEERFAKIKNLAHLSAAQFFDSGKID